MEQKVLQVGALVLLLALLLRLAGSFQGMCFPLAQTLLCFSTGRLIAQPVVSAAESPPPEPETQPPPPAVPVFGAEDAAFVEVMGQWQVNVEALLRQPLIWDLTGEAPTVLIVHTHGTESYEKSADYQETAPYRTLDTSYNVVSVGDRLEKCLEAGGIQVIHDRTCYDHPNYNDAYVRCREAIEAHLAEHPSIRMVLDLHRDAAEDSSGNQKFTTIDLQGTATAPLMLVMGSDKGSREFPRWEENLALAVKLQAQLEKTHPGLCRPIHLVSYRYNQDLSTGGLLIEVGSAGNAHSQALAAAERLAEGILALAKGANI